MKEVKEGACGLELPPGLHGIDYKQKFVKAPESLHPKCYRKPEMKYEGHEAMDKTMGK